MFVLSRRPLASASLGDEAQAKCCASMTLLVRANNLAAIAVDRSCLISRARPSERLRSWRLPGSMARPTRICAANLSARSCASVFCVIRHGRATCRLFFGDTNLFEHFLQLASRAQNSSCESRRALAKVEQRPWDGSSARPRCISAREEQLTRELHPGLVTSAPARPRSANN